MTHRAYASTACGSRQVALAAGLVSLRLRREVTARYLPGSTAIVLPPAAPPPPHDTRSRVAPSSSTGSFPSHFHRWSAPWPMSRPQKVPSRCIQNDSPPASG